MKKSDYLFEKIVETLDLEDVMDESQIEEFFEATQKDLLENNGLETIQLLEKQKNFSSYKDSIDSLIKDVTAQVESEKEEKRIKESLSGDYTLKDLSELLSRELVGKEVRDFTDCRWIIEKVLEIIDKKFFIQKDDYSDKVIYLYYDCGEDRYTRYYYQQKNPRIGTITITRHKTKDKWNKPYVLGEVDFECKEKEATLSSVLKAWQDKKEAEKKALDEKEAVFVQNIKEHGFESFEEFCEFLKTASERQRKKF